MHPDGDSKGVNDLLVEASSIIRDSAFFLSHK
jgi:hypothetical protein